MTRILAWPVAVDNAGRLVVIAAASDEHATQAVGILANTRIGERVQSPEMGTPDPVGRRRYDRAALDAAAAQYAPFAELVDVEERFDPDDPQLVNVTAKVRRSPNG